MDSESFIETSEQRVKKTLAEIYLLLANPHKESLHTYPGGFRVDAYDGGDDESTGLVRAARKQDLAVSAPTVLAVRVLFQDADPDDQGRLAEGILQFARAADSSVIGALIVDLGLTKPLLAWLEQAGVHNVRRDAILHGVRVALKARPRALSDDELQDLLSIGAGTDEAPWFGKWPNTPERKALDGFRATVLDVLRLRLTERVLQNANVAVDRDRRELLHRMDKLGVADDLRNLLHAADLDASHGDAKGGLEKLRTFLERTCEECCRRVADRAPGLPAGNAGGSIGPWLTFAEAAKLYSEHEVKVVRTLYGFLSMAGSHAIGSTPEQFTVARSTVIEWCLLMTGRV